jgi:sporulation protein YlmC with PRC-barrel domain
MLLSGSQIIDTPIMGLQTGTELARTHSAVINPHDLAIIAYEVEGPSLDESPSLLRIADIRELSDIGMIIDSSDEFVGISDVIKLQDIYEQHFVLEGKQVTDEKGEKIGKIIDYTIDSNSFIVQQLNVKRPLLKSFNDDELLVHRSQILEINDQSIVIKSKASHPKPVLDKDSYVNPFRRQSPQTEAIEINKDA